jgi:predicted ATPase
MYPGPHYKSAFLTQGRENELARLRAFLERSLEGHPQIIFLTGDAGIGKTRLMQGFCDWSQETSDELVVLWGQCSIQPGSNAPYLPFKEVLRTISGNSEELSTGTVMSQENARRLKRTAGYSGQAIIELAPDLIGVFIPAAGLLIKALLFVAKKIGWIEYLEKLEKGNQSQADIAPEQIFEQFSRVLFKIAERVPLILVLDDLHWADAGSLNLLFYLSRRLDGAKCRLMIVGTYRPSEVKLGNEEGRHPLENISNEIHRYRGDIEIDLTATISGETGRAFVDAVLDAEPNSFPRDFRRVVFELTQGHPLYTVELLIALQERGALAKDERGRWFVSQPISLEELPKKIEAVIKERVDRVAPELRRVLDCGCVEGEEFTAEVISQVYDLPMLPLAKHLDSDLRARHRLVIESGESWSGEHLLHYYRFQHNMFRQYLYDSLGHLQRQQLHGAVGSALEKVHAPDLSAVADKLALHFDLAGKAAKSILYYRQAADSARLSFSNEAALPMYSRALEMLGEDGDISLRLDLLMGRERIYNLIGRREFQKADLDDLLNLVSIMGDGTHQAEVYNRLADYHSVLSDFGASIRAAVEAQEVARRCGDAQAEATSLVLQAWAYQRLGEAEPARQAALAAIIAADAAGDLKSKANAFNHLGSVHHDAGSYKEAQEYYEQALGIMRALLDVRGEAITQINLGIIHYRTRHYAEARRCYEEALAVRHNIGDRVGEATALSNLGVLYYTTREYEAAMEAQRRSLNIRVEVGEQQGVGISLMNLALIEHALGYHAEARAHLVEAVEIRRALRDRRGVAISLNNLAHVMCATREYEYAVILQKRALKTLHNIGARSDEAYSLSYLGRALEGCGRLEAADEAYTAALQLRRDLDQHALAVSDLAGLARVASARGETATALLYVQEALSGVEAYGAMGIDDLGDVYLTCVRVLKKCGHPVQASDVLRQARSDIMEVATKIGDDAVRRSFLNNVVEHAELKLLWERNHQ